MFVLVVVIEAWQQSDFPKTGFLISMLKLEVCIGPKDLAPDL